MARRDSGRAVGCSDLAAVVEQQQVTDGAGALDQVVDVVERSEERRVGKEGSGQWYRDPYKKAKRDRPGGDLEAMIDRDAVSGSAVGAVRGVLIAALGA